VRQKKEEGLLAWEWLRAKRIEEWERERERRRGFFLKKNFFQTHFSNIQTPIKQNPCIRIMMHKHLLFLNYLVMFNYFKSHFV
jgi:gluconate kinase